MNLTVSQLFVRRSFVKRRAPYAMGPLTCLSVLSVRFVYCGQTAGWIKMPLGTEVGLSTGDIVLDGDPAHPTETGTAAPPLFGPRLLWPNDRPSQQLLSFCFQKVMRSVTAPCYDVPLQCFGPCSGGLA